MSNSVTETSSIGWISKIIESIKGVGVGCLLILIAIVALFWNEGRTVKRARDLAEGRGALVQGAIDKVDSANEGKLVYLSGKAESASTLRDEQYGVEAPLALKLDRTSEMYQWDEDKKTEKRKKLGGGEERTTTYTYKQIWSERLLDSSDYHTSGHDNPPTKSIESASINAKDAKLGQFALNDVIIDELDAKTLITPKLESIPAAKSPTTKPVTAPQVSSGMLYFGNADSPKTGDVRLRFTSFPSGPISLIARQLGNSFEPYKASNGLLLLVESGAVSADLMFKHAEDTNKMIGWIIRGVGFLMLAIGFGMIFRPLVAIADVVPLIGSVIGAGTFIAALIFAVPVWCITVALAWLVYRPLIGLALLAVAIAVPLWLMKFRKPKVIAPTTSPALPAR